MKRFLPAVLLAAACGGPSPIDLRDYEAPDHRFQEPPVRSAAEAILRKEELTLEDALKIADLLNPTLESERRSVDLATAAIWEASLHPNPTLGVQIEEYRTSGGSFGDSKRVAGVTIPIALAGRIGKATSAAEQDRVVGALTYVWRRREILNGVKRAFVRVLATRRAEGLARETRDIARSLHVLTDDRFQAQAVPEMQVLKTAVNLATAESDLKRAESAAAISVKALLALLGDIDFPKDRFAGDLALRFTVPSLEALRGQVLALHPLGEAARAAREAADLHVAAAEAAWPADIEITVAAGKDGGNDTIFEGGIAVPLPLFNRNQGVIRAAEIRRRQAELHVQSVRNDLLLSLEETWRTFTTAQERARVYREEILPKAQKALDLTDEGYKLGKFGYLDVLDAQRTLAESRTAYTAALEDLNLSAADLEKLTGTRLQAIQ